jgi:cyclopropane fatty-acyl-phospholipid synthase-like methyltransferase
MLGAGLQPSDTLLDVGCGCFRGGLHFLAYLDDGGYVGLDKDAAQIRVGRANCRGRINGKGVTAIVSGDFDLSGYEGYFDFALAHSLFPHLQRHEISACLRAVRDALKDGGRLYATYFEAPPQDYNACRQARGGVVTTLNSDPFHHEIAFYEQATNDLGMTLVNIGEWDHPRSQKMLEFRKAGWR